MNNRRINRISEEVKKVISDMLFNGLKDPRIRPMTSVTHVEVTRDLRFARVYISVLGDKDDKEETIKGIESAKGFIRKEIGNRIDLRYVPEPIIILDESIEDAIKLSKLIEEVNKNTNQDLEDED